MTPTSREGLLSWADDLACFLVSVGTNGGTRPPTLTGLPVRRRWWRRLSRAPAAGTCHRWSEACSSSAGPGPLGPYQ